MKLPDRLASISLNLVGLGTYWSQYLGEKNSISVYGNWTNHYGLKAINPNSLSDLNNVNNVDGGIYWISHLGKNINLKVFNFSILENYEYKNRAPSFEGSFQQEKKRNQAVINLSQARKNFQWEWNQGINYSDAGYSLGIIDLQANNFDYFSSFATNIIRDNFSIKTGLSFDAHRIDTKGRFPSFYYAYDLHHPSQTFDTSVWIILPELFAYGKKNLSDDVTLGGGLRWNPGVKEIDSYLSAQANLAYRLDKHSSFILSGGMYQKYELPNAADNGLVRMESRQASLDYLYNKQAWKINAAIYFKENQRGEIDNPIYGAELFATYTHSKFATSISIASIQSKWKTKEVVYPGAFDFSYFLRALAKYKIGSGGFQINAVYKMRQGQYFVPVIDTYQNTALNVFAPIYAPQENGRRYPMYKVFDVGISKLFPTTFGTLITYFNAGNIFDFKNIRSYNYNDDYSQRFAEYFNRRVIFFGCVLQFD